MLSQALLSLCERPQYVLANNILHAWVKGNAIKGDAQGEREMDGKKERAAERSSAKRVSSS